MLADQLMSCAVLPPSPMKWRGWGELHRQAAAAAPVGSGCGTSQQRPEGSSWPATLPMPFCDLCDFNVYSVGKLIVQQGRKNKIEIEAGLLPPGGTGGGTEAVQIGCAGLLAASFLEPICPPGRRCSLTHSGKILIRAVDGWAGLLGVVQGGKDDLDVVANEHHDQASSNSVGAGVRAVGAGEGAPVDQHTAT